MFDGGEYSYAYSPTSDEVLCKKSKKGKGNSNKRRFSEEQIKCLETMFESEARLEPRKKLKLASELGLQPRQVAIWFQNKRARWKSKQLERDYSLLLANYNALASRVEALNKDKQALLLQLQKLDGDTAMKREEDDRSSEEKCDEKKAVESFGVDEETGIVIAAEPAESSLTSPDEYWDGLDSKALFNYSSNGYEQWWDFWS